MVGSQCEFGSEFRKNTRFLTNAPWMSEVLKMCPGEPEHPKHPPLVGHFYDGSGVRHWKTELAAEYPQAMAQAMAEAYIGALREAPYNTPPVVEVSIKGVSNPVRRS